MEIRNFKIKKWLIPFVIFLGGMGALLAFNEISPDKDLVSVKPDGRLQYKWYPPALPAKMNFGGEKVPLDRWEVRERLDRDILMNYYMHGSLLYILKLSTRYFPIIEERLAANHVPDDFKYLCVAESSLQHLRSSAGAQSFWQFLKSTAKEYDLEVNDEVDERFHVEKATDAACEYLKKAHDRFGSWTAAAASYNCGMGGFSRRADEQGSGNYYDLLLPEETNRYIFRILALKYLISGATQMGYIVKGADAYQPVKTRKITVTESIPNLITFAKDNGTSYKLLKLVNPWLRSNSLTISKGNSYVIDIPLDRQ